MLLPENFDLFFHAYGDPRFESCFDLEQEAFIPRGCKPIRNFIFNHAYSYIQKTSNSEEIIAEALDRCHQAITGFAMREVRDLLGEGDLEGVFVWPYGGAKYLQSEEFWRTRDGKDALELGYLMSDAKCFDGLPDWWDAKRGQLAIERVYFFIAEGKPKLIGDSQDDQISVTVEDAVSRTGRPETYPREKLLEAACIFLLHKNLPSTQSKFFSEIQSIFQAHGDDEPSAETLRKKLGSFYNRLLDIEKSELGSK